MTGLRPVTPLPKLTVHQEFIAKARSGFVVLVGGMVHLRVGPVENAQPRRSSLSRPRQVFRAEEGIIYQRVAPS